MLIAGSFVDSEHGVGLIVATHWFSNYLCEGEHICI